MNTRPKTIFFQDPALGDFEIGDGKPCFIIAEIGNNHDRDWKVLEELIDVCAAAGCDAVKFQTFTGREFLSPKVPGAELAGFDPEASKYERLVDFWDDIALPYDWHARAFDYARGKNILPFSTPSTVKGAEFLLSLGAGLFKAASQNLAHLPFFEGLARLRKPIIASVGMSTEEEITDMVRVVRAAGNNDLIITHCVADYPAKPETLNLRYMKTLRDTFDALAGFSDHSLGVDSSALAVCEGACVIEKHVTLGRTRKGPDHPFALEPNEISLLVQKIRMAEKALSTPADKKAFINTIPEAQAMLGKGERILCAGEKANRSRWVLSIHALKKIPKGSALTEDMLTVVCPKDGLAPKHWWKILGKKTTRDLDEYDPITFDCLEP